MLQASKHLYKSFHVMSSTLVMLGFAGAFYVGHLYEWQIPKFSSFVGTSATDADDWCADHSVPASICVECNQDLMPRDEDFGWCAEHGVHNCLWEHPQLAERKQAATPGFVEDQIRRAEASLAITDRKENNSRCTLYRNRIQFTSIESVKQAGVDIGLVEQNRIVESIHGNGEIVYDPTRRASVSARVPGNVWSIETKLGDRVRKGELLALVDATLVGQAKSALLRALAEESLQRKNVARLSDTNGAVAGSRILEAEAALAKARADVLDAEQAILNLGLRVDASELQNFDEHELAGALRYLGIPDAKIAEVEQGIATSNMLPVIAPMDGTVIRRNVSLGEVVDPARPLFEIADTTVMWLELSLPLESVNRLAIGQPIRFKPDGSNRTLEGAVDWISTGADEHTRMVDVRAVLRNPKGQLRDRMYGSGEVVLREVDDAIVVPSEAVHWEGCCHIVFVRDQNYFASSDSPKVFHVREVRPGATHDGNTEIIAGVLPGEVVAVEGSDVMRAQLLKNGLGAGCCVE